MKNTILSQIIKKTLLTEQFRPRKDSTKTTKPISTNITAAAAAKAKAKAKAAAKAKADAKAAADAKASKTKKIKPGTDYIVNPPMLFGSKKPYRHMIFNKGSDGKWRFEYYDDYDESIKTGEVTGDAVLAKLNSAKGKKEWDGMYDGQSVTKKEWFELMAKYDPAFPGVTEAPMLSNEAMTTLAVVGMLVVKSIGLIAGLRYGWKGIQWLKGMRAEKVELAVLSGLSKDGVLSMKQWTNFQYGTGKITKAQRNQLQGIYSNSKYWRVVDTATFNAMKNEVIRGNRTMSELITVMPEAYREQKGLVDALLKYERDVLNMYPGRETKWLVAAEKWAKQQSLTRTEIEKLFPGLVSRRRRAPKPGEKHPMELGWQGQLSLGQPGFNYNYTGPGGGGIVGGIGDKVAAAEKAKTALAAKEAKAALAAAKKKALDVAAKAIAKAEAVSLVDYWAAKTDKLIALRKAKRLTTTKTDILKTPKNTIDDWEKYLGSGTAAGSDIIKLRDQLLLLTTKKDAIAKIKRFAIAHNWKPFKNKYIETFMNVHLTYYKK